MAGFCKRPKCQRHNVSAQLQLLTILSKARKGLTARQLFNLMETYDCEKTLRILVSQAAARGFIRIDGKVECDHCGSAANCYRITEKGRESINKNS